MQKLLVRVKEHIRGSSSSSLLCKWGIKQRGNSQANTGK